MNFQKHKDFSDEKRSLWTTVYLENLRNAYGESAMRSVNSKSYLVEAAEEADKALAEFVKRFESGPQVIRDSDGNASAIYCECGKTGCPICGQKTEVAQG